VAIAVFLVSVVAGCAGGGRMSAREYVRHASKVCRDARIRSHHLELTGSPAGTASARAVARAAEIHAETAAALADLHPPARLAAFDAQWVALIRQVAAELDALATSLTHKDRSAVVARSDAVRVLTERAVALGRAHGISACPTPFTPASRRG
jgi:hypothetical protein